MPSIKHLQKGERYWYIDLDALNIAQIENCDLGYIVKETTYYGLMTEDTKFLLNLAFDNEYEAYKEAVSLFYLLLFRASGGRTFDETKENWSVYVKTKETGEKVLTTAMFKENNIPTVYFDSEEMAENAINRIGPEKFVRHILGMEHSNFWVKLKM